MASTIYYSEAVNAIASAVPRITEDKLAITWVNRAVYEIWRRYDWKEYMKTLEPFWLIGGVQDYPWAMPDYFWGLHKAYIARLAPEPAEYYPLRILRDLELTHQKQIPHSIGWDKTRSSLRVFPAPIGGLEAPLWCVKGEYKAVPMKLASISIYDNAIPWDDVHFSVFCDVLKWCALEAANSPAAEAQMKKAMFAIDKMAEDEGVAEGDGATAPATGLALGGANLASISPFNRLW